MNSSLVSEWFYWFSVSYQRFQIGESLHLFIHIYALYSIPWYISVFHVYPLCSIRWYISVFHIYSFCSICWYISRDRNKVYLFDRSFLVLMKITLQLNYCNLGFWWCSKSPIWSSSFIVSFNHFSCKERPDLQKINLFTLIPYFSQKIPSSTVILFPAPLKSKAVQGSQFRKASIPRVTQCHRTQTLHEIQSLWFIRLGYLIKKQHFFLMPLWLSRASKYL